MSILEKALPTVIATIITLLGSLFFYIYQSDNSKKNIQEQQRNEIKASSYENLFTNNPEKISNLLNHGDDESIYLFNDVFKSTLHATNNGSTFSNATVEIDNMRQMKGLKFIYSNVNATRNTLQRIENCTFMETQANIKSNRENCTIINTSFTSSSNKYEHKITINWNNGVFDNLEIYNVNATINAYHTTIKNLTIQQSTFALDLDNCTIERINFIDYNPGSKLKIRGSRIEEIYYSDNENYSIQNNNNIEIEAKANRMHNSTFLYKSMEEKDKKDFIKRYDITIMPANNSTQKTSNNSTQQDSI